MTVESTNPVDAGSDNNDLSAIDHPDNLNFDDELEEANGTETEPEVTPDTEEESAASEDDGEQSETEESGDDASEGEEADEANPADVAIPDDAVITLANGEKVKFGDLKKSPMLEKDYRHKTQALGNQRRELEAMNTRTQRVLDHLVKYLESKVPDAPTPDLAYRDPVAYTRMKALHEASMAEIKQVIAMGAQAGQVTEQLTAEQHQELIQAENAKLIEKLPDIADPVKREAFNKATWETAQHFGFTADELSGMSDHRILLLGHYARLGMEAEKAKASVKAKVEKLPPATPVKKRGVTAGDPAFLARKEAQRRLAKTGSIHDAVKAWDG